jgi:hypothetical protein
VKAGGKQNEVKFVIFGGVDFLWAGGGGRGNLSQFGLLRFRIKMDSDYRRSTVFGNKVSKKIF